MVVFAQRGAHALDSPSFPCTPTSTHPTRLHPSYLAGDILGIGVQDTRLESVSFDASCANVTHLCALYTWAASRCDSRTRISRDSHMCCLSPRPLVTGGSDTSDI